MLNLFNQIWSWLKNLHPDIIRFICAILLLWVFLHYTLNGIGIAIKDTNKSEIELKEDREKYTVEITPKVNELVKDMLVKDPKISNVILLNYHNTLVSSNGLSYRYLTSICEQFLGDESLPTFLYWKELDYMNYGEEIQKINADDYVIFDSIANYRKTYPKLTYILERCELKSAVVCAIKGVESYIGMIVIGSKEGLSKQELEQYVNNIEPEMQPLSTMLDYDYVKKSKNAN